ncbi:hypothetical protein ACOSQ4_021267 [Xanthoceras sorbifolium]
MKLKSPTNNNQDKIFSKKYKKYVPMRSATHSLPSHFKGKQRMEGFLKMSSSLETATLSDQKCFIGCHARHLCLLHMPRDILVRKAMEITSQQLQVYYSTRKKLLNLKDFNTASTSKHTTNDKSRLQDLTNEDEKQCSEKYFVDSAASGSHEADQNLVQDCSTSKVCRYSLQADEVEELDKRLMKLEEENDAMKQIFIKSMEERRMLVNEIYVQFRRIHHCNCLMIVKSSKHAAMETGLLQLLIEDSNPCIVNRDHRALRN